MFGVDKLNQKGIPESVCDTPRGEVCSKFNDKKRNPQKVDFFKYYTNLKV